jgi:endo-1,4-beta-xylanase
MRVFPTLWEHHAVEGITLWGWRIGMWRTTQGAYLINANGSERFALGWLRTYVPILLDAEEASVPAAFRLMGNYPNPFNPRTTIEYELERAGTVRLEVLDVTGRPVATLVDGFQPAAAHRVDWDATWSDGRAVPSGVYLYRLTLGAGGASSTATRPMVVVK